VLSFALVSRSFNPAKEYLGTPKMLDCYSCFLVTRAKEV
jgi:hypothetical protein